MRWWLGIGNESGIQICGWQEWRKGLCPTVYLSEDGVGVTRPQISSLGSPALLWVFCWLSGRRQGGWCASRLLYCFHEILSGSSWGNTAAISSDYSYLQVTENKKPSQSVLYKCLSFLILFSHKIGNRKVGWNLFSTADQRTTRHLVSVTPSLMCQFSSSSLTLCNCKMAINLSFPI